VISGTLLAAYLAGAAGPPRQDGPSSHGD